MKTTIILSVIFTVAFVISFNWANGLDYSSQYASMMPLGITGILGIATLSSLGGVLGAWLDSRELKN
jgi:hypothetical protein